MGEERIKKVKTVEDGIEHLRQFVLFYAQAILNGGYGGNTWAVLTEDKQGNLVVYERLSQPCYGEMRPYGNITHAHKDAAEPNLLPEDQRKVHKPTDLYHPFPKANPIAIAVVFRRKLTERTNTLIDCMYDEEESPWRIGLSDVELVNIKDTHVGVILKDTHVNPTVMVNLFRASRDLREVCDLIWNEDLTERQFIACYGMLQKTGDGYYISNDGNYTFFGNTPDLQRIADCNPVNYHDDRTFYDRDAYNRPRIDYIWQGTKSLKEQLKLSNKRFYSEAEAKDIIKKICSIVN